MKKFTVENACDSSDYILNKYGEALTFGRLMKLYRQKDVKVNGKRINKRVRLEKGDEIEVYFDGENAGSPASEKPPIKTVYSDENIVICEKPPKISSEDFYERVKGEYPQSIYTHRLDTNTRGLIFFALNQKAYDELYKGLKNRDFKKYYYCVVNGKVENLSGVLNGFLFKDAKKGEVKIYDEKVRGALPVKTAYEVIAQGENSSLLKVELITGRTHQIRAHLAHAGHFILGDGKYGVEKINRTQKAKGQLLVSAEIVFKFDKGEQLYYLNGKDFKIDCDFLKAYLY